MNDRTPVCPVCGRYSVGDAVCGMCRDLQTIPDDVPEREPRIDEYQMDYVYDGWEP